VLNVGDMVDVYIKDFNKDEGKISLSLKQIKGNPWDDIDKKYEVGQIIKGKVVKLVDFGAFVEIEPGIEGLLHISQISEKHISKPSEELEVGQTVTIKILDINKEEKRISLSIKEALESESVENYTDEIVKEEQTTTTIGDIIKFKENN
jgi:ribosomal protein S1